MVQQFTGIDDVATFLDSMEHQIKDDQIKIEYGSRRTSSSKISSSTPIKRLIAQEMSDEPESKHKPPSVVAKLMGLDAFPGKQLNSTAQGCPPKSNPGYTSTQQGTMSTYRHQGMGFQDKSIQHGVHQSGGQREYKDIYTVWQQPPRKNSVQDRSLQKEKYNETLYEKKMAVVRQKFIEAKRLATDEKLRQSKEFQDALEVLSSNKDIFLKFLQEPNSLISQQVPELQFIPPPPETNRITVLKPSKTLENNRFIRPEKRERQTMKPTQAAEESGQDKDGPSWSSAVTHQDDDSSAQPMRIVVLRPSPGKAYDVRSIGSSPTASPSRRLLSNKEYYVDLEDDEAKGSTEITKEITQQMHEHLSGHHVHETFPSSRFSYSYIGDENSLNRSENGYVEEGNISHLGGMTPTSRHSWDYINLSGSPYSSSSFSHASCSPESSVCREAKKRLSERWALIATTGNSPEQRQARRNSSTLWEMLALSSTKNTAISGKENCAGSQNVFSSRSCGGEQDMLAPISGGSTSKNEENSGEASFGNLVRSRSVPKPSMVQGSRLNVEVSDPKVDESLVPKEEMKSKSRKSSLRGKFSSLFSSRSKKTSEGKSTTSVTNCQDESPNTASEVPLVLNPISSQKTSNKVAYCVTDRIPRGDLSSKSSSPAFCVGAKQGTFLNEALSSNSGMLVEDQGQPSPISVLETLFDDNGGTTREAPRIVLLDHHGQPVHNQPLISSLIDKSPPIESIARTLSSNGACLLSTASSLLNPSRFSLKAAEEEQLLFVRALLSAAGLDNEEQSGAVFAKWHSPDSPLNPSLLDKICKLNDARALLHESKRRQLSSNRRLLFDCVNAALADIMEYGSEVRSWEKASNLTKNKHSIGSPVSVDEVWGRVKELYAREAKCFSGGNGDNNSLVVETMIRKEVTGKGWEELKRMERDAMVKEIGGEVLEKLLNEVLVDLTGWL